MKEGFFAKTGIFFLKIVARFPFWLIYFLSDILYVVVYYIVGYRKQVVFQNLKNSFPEKSDREIKKIQKKFFRHLADQTLETVKIHRISENDFSKRFVIKNPEILEPFFNKNKSIVMLTMHYNNWEYSVGLPLKLKHRMLAVYRPLHNKLFDEFINKARRKFNTELVKDSSSLRRIIRAENQNEAVFTWLAGDQTPHFSEKFWFKFLNQDTIFFQGGAYISRRFNHPVVFQKIKKTARGKYECSFELLFDEPEKVTDVEILSVFIKKMEEVIKEHPEYYLWSHRRWKHKKPSGVKLLNE